MDLQRLKLCLQLMNSSCSSQHCRDAIETLLKIHRNIYFNKDDPKYRILQLHNRLFCSKVWNLVPARNFMTHCGWTQVDGKLLFQADENLLYIINTLLEHRFVAPQTGEWKEETKIENLHTSQQREKMLKEKAVLERNKELEEYKKDKMYREQLAQNIKQQIADDRKQNRERFTKPVVGNELDKNKRYVPSAPYHLHDTNTDTFRRLGG